MIRNYYTLSQLCKELNSLSGSIVTDVFTQEKDTVTFSLLKDSSEFSLHFVADGRNDSFFIRNNFQRAKKNTFNLFDDITEETFISAEVMMKNRILRLNFINTYIYVVLFGGVNSNLIITTKQGKIIDAFKNKEILASDFYKIESHELKKWYEFDSETNIHAAIANSDLLFGKLYAEEFLFRNNINFEIKINELNSEQVAKIDILLFDFCDSIKNSNEYYIYEVQNKKIMTLIQLSNYELKQKYSSVSQAILSKIINDIVETGFNPEYKKLSAIISRIQRKLSNKIESHSDFTEAHDRIAKYRKYADLLMSQCGRENNVSDKLTVLDWTGEQLVIEINPKKSIIENAQRYYEKAKSGEQDIRARRKLLPKFKDELEIINSIKIEFDRITNLKDLEKFKINYRKILGLQMEAKAISREEKFRKFDLGEGYILYVGKNAANNDELTMKFAKPNDLWFHARGMSGSHSVLRTPNPDKKPPKYVMEQAAAITAYYSGAKNSNYAPVAYTQKKNVRKPKGANPGSVLVSREDVIMVTPGLPEGSNQD